MSITARILSIQGGGWAGIALQETLSPGSKKVALKSQLNNFILREIRSVTGGNQNLMSLFRPQHVWLKLTRTGNTFTGYTSNNGVSWSMAFSTSIVMGSCIQIGLFAESINNSSQTMVEFDQVNIISQQVNMNFNNDQVQIAGTEIRVADDTNIYPNPVNDILFVNLNPQQIENTYSIQLIDMLGSVITEIKAGGGLQLSNQLDMTELSPGVYFLNLIFKQNIRSSYKIIKQ